MAVKTTHVFLVLLLFAGLTCRTEADSGAEPATSAIEVKTGDGIAIFGETYFDGVDPRSPLILLFHQGGSNGRGEYAEIVPWLNSAGFRAIAWDQRRGGERHGSVNRSVAALPEGVEYSYCDAAADLQAALDHVVTSGLAEQVIVWGSSYSASLVFKLAADNPSRVRGVIAFSPAAGGPLADCRARQWAAQITAPMFVLRPATEMERPSSVEQRDLLTAAGARFLVVSDGRHGSSMLVDSRTNADMSLARQEVEDWLSSLRPDDTFD